MNCREMDQVAEKKYFCLSESPIYLSKFTEEELHSDKYLTWMNDYNITMTIGRYDYLFPVSRNKLTEYYNSQQISTVLFLAIYIKDPIKDGTTDFIGTVKIYDIDLLARKASIGILIGDRRNWNKGYATGSIRIVCNYLFNVLGLRKICAGYYSTNMGIKKAFQKNGFQIEATFKEHIFIKGTLVDQEFVCKFKKDINDEEIKKVQ